MAKEIWGPPLWRLLHSLAERLGNQQVPLLATDEKLLFINLLRAVGNGMPCFACRTHFRDWCSRRPLERLASSYRIREDAREWLWALHQEVNAERGVTGGPTLEEIPGLYGSRTVQELNTDYRDVCDTFRSAVQAQQMRPDAFMTFKMRVVGLRGLVG